MMMKQKLYEEEEIVFPFSCCWTKNHKIPPFRLSFFDRNPNHFLQCGTKTGRKRVDFSTCRSSLSTWPGVA